YVSYDTSPDNVNIKKVTMTLTKSVPTDFIAITLNHDNNSNQDLRSKLKNIEFTLQSVITHYYDGNYYFFEAEDNETEDDEEDENNENNEQNDEQQYEKEQEQYEKEQEQYEQEQYEQEQYEQEQYEQEQ